MAEATEAVRFILRLAEKNRDAETKRSPMKIQKLLYYAQGYFLAVSGDPLFDGRIEHWDKGPVVPDIWKKIKYDGLLKNLSGDESAFDLTENQQVVLRDVYLVYGQYAWWRLSEMTHQESPWLNTAQNEEITSAHLINYFKPRIEDFVEKAELIEDQKSILEAMDEPTESWDAVKEKLFA